MKLTFKSQGNPDGGRPSDFELASTIRNHFVSKNAPFVKSWDIKGGQVAVAIPAGADITDVADAAELYLIPHRIPYIVEL